MGRRTKSQRQQERARAARARARGLPTRDSGAEAAPDQRGPVARVQRPERARSGDVAGEGRSKTGWPAWLKVLVGVLLALLVVGVLSRLRGAP